MARTPEPTAATETITINVRPLFGEVRTLTVPKDATVAELLSGGGYSDNAEVRQITEEGTTTLVPGTVLEDGDTVQIVSAKKITNG